MRGLGTPNAVNAGPGDCAVPAPALLRLGTRSGRWVVTATILGSALAGIDGSVVSIALPAIGRDLQASFAGLQATITGYSLTLAALILLSGAAGDRLGRRRVFVSGVVWFTTASLLCAMAPTIELLIAARVLQGIGAALLTPSSLAILEASFRSRDRASAVGTWAGFSGVAGALAPFVGGWLLAVASWRWVFLINVPLAALVVVAAVRHIPESWDREATGRLDWLGALATVAFLGFGTFALLRLREGTSHVAIASAAAAVLTFLAFLRHERHQPAPLLPLNVFRIRQFTATNAVTFVVYAPIGVFFLLLVLMLQVVAGWSPLAAGAATIPVTALTLSLSRPSAALAQVIGPRLQMTAGPLLCAAGALLARGLGPGTDYLDVLPSVITFGLGLATMVAPLTATALASLPATHSGVASGVNNAVARTASLLAIAAVPGLVGLTGDAWQEPARFEQGFCTALAICAVLFIAGSILAALTVRRPDPT